MVILLILCLLLTSCSMESPSSPAWFVPSPTWKTPFIVPTVSRGYGSRTRALTRFEPIECKNEGRLLFFVFDILSEPNAPKSFWSTGRSNGRQQLITPSKGSRPERIPIEAYSKVTFCRAVALEISIVRIKVMTQIL